MTDVKKNADRQKNTQEKIADSVTDVIANESMTGIENVGRISWFGLGVILLAFVYVGMNSALDIFTKILAMLSLIYTYQCIIVVVSALSRIAQKTASILGIVAMFTVTYEESGLNVMKAFFDGVSKAAESSISENSQAKTEVKNR